MDVAVFGASFCVLFLLFWMFVLRRVHEECKIPGPKRTSDPSNGHLKDIRSCHGLHPYLVHLHKTYGDVVTFTVERQQMVSVASVEAFKQVQHLFDRPVELFENFVPLIGRGSIQMTNGSEGQQMHRTFSRPFAFTQCKEYYDIVSEFAMELVSEFNSLSPETHIPVCKRMRNVALKTIVAVAFGQKISEDRVSEFEDNYDVAYAADDSYFIKEPDSNVSREEIRLAAAKCRQFTKDLLHKRLEERQSGGQERFVDAVIDYGWREDDDRIVDNALTFLIGGFHTTAYLLAWMLYYLAENQIIQDEVQREIDEIVGSENEVTYDFVLKTKLLKNVIEETLRLSLLGPYAGRCASADVKIGRFVIPANTPIILPLGVVHMEEKYWSDPNRFDPHRFSWATSQPRLSLAFVPFGFAGKRICPGQHLARLEVATIMCFVLLHFRFSLVAGQNIQPVHGLVTKPDAEIWLTVSRRQ